MGDILEFKVATGDVLSAVGLKKIMRLFSGFVDVWTVNESYITCVLVIRGMSAGILTPTDSLAKGSIMAITYLCTPVGANAARCFL